MEHVREVRHFHVFGASGGGGKGFNRGKARVKHMVAQFRCIGSVDVDPGACRDFERHVGVPATVLDLFDRSQYIAWHGHEPPPGWREATPEDIRRAAGNERPHIVFLSAPCKGFSGLTSPTKAATEKYQALNRLTLRGIWLTLEAWKDDLPEFILFENVPRCAGRRGRPLLDQINALLLMYGYAVNETTHDCGELGGLAQSRKRFLLVARHREKVPPFLYEPRMRPLRSVGSVLERCPMPNDIAAAGPMHRLPSLQWKTWVRLAFVEAGSDWRSLKDLRVEDGILKDYALVADEAYRNGVLGVKPWNSASGAVTGRTLPYNGAFAVADPRNHGHAFSKYSVARWDHHTRSVISGSTTGEGAFAVADPRPGFDRSSGNFMTGGHYGVVDFGSHSGAVTSAACHDNGPWSVADPRIPGPKDKVQAVIVARDGTFHRPFTTYELACLQSYIEPEEQLFMDGMNDEVWRERIGNMVPPASAEAVASVMGTTLLLAWSGETFFLDNAPIWVQPIATAVSLPNVAVHG